MKDENQGRFDLPVEGIMRLSEIIYNEDGLEPDNTFFFDPKSTTKYKYVAYCTSKKCCIEAGLKDRGYGGKIRDVPKGTDNCPKCGYFLFWDKQEVSVI